MRPEKKSQRLLGVTRSKAKMIEYSVPDKYQNIDLSTDPAQLFTLCIGILGDLTASTNRGNLQPEALAELRRELIFSARFFDSYLQSKLNESLDPYLILLGSASYYLCDLPGSSMVLAKRIGANCPDLESEGLEDLLLWLLQSDLSTYFEGSEGPFGEYIDMISHRLLLFFKNGTDTENLFDLSSRLRKTVYESGTPRQLLLGDVIATVLAKKHENSCWNALPIYSGLHRDQWLQVLQKESFIKELWPAQHAIGMMGVLRGESAVIQMPTSAGKTKANELIIRSAFLAERTSLAIIVAPFRALCHEIKNSLISAFRNESIKVDELSDALQTDFDIAAILGNKLVLVITPEKLQYVIRQAPELAASIGLVIFDEGHQFDNGTRGITYELLLTSLRSMLPKGAQKILISAVISNAKALGEWLNGTESKIVVGTNLMPTFRSVGFASWLDLLGRIEYVSNEDAEKGEFFVPRVIEKFKLKNNPRERKDRIFPEKSDGQAIALYLGFKLVSNGSIAIFCGRKMTAASICERAVEFIERGMPLPLPSEFSDQMEMQKLCYLHERNLGLEAPATKSARYGIFSHHGNTPHGIRLAVEHAMREGLIHFVVCTSTLAQGVNLPIRYLIVTSVYQGSERIKVRDFHNLIGRVGRAGMHTEGSILFADPIIFDGRNNRDDKWRWKQVKELLELGNSEPCISNLLSLFEPISSDDNKSYIAMETMDFVKAYVNAPEEVAKFAEKIVQFHKDKNFSKVGVERQISWKINLISSIESFLMSNWDVNDCEISEQDIISLAEETLAYFLADETKREQICDLFKLLAENISRRISDSGRRKIYGRTLYGARDAQEIDEWVQANIGRLSAANTINEIMYIVWPIMAKHIHNGVFNKCDNPAVLQDIAIEWIQGNSFSELLDTLRKKEAKLIWGTKRREFNVDHVIEICEGGLAYDGALIIGALCEFVELVEQEETSELISRLQLFQKQLKYGLPNDTAIILYELGFSDRVIAQELSALWDNQRRIKVKRFLRSKNSEIISLLNNYPHYYLSEIYEKLV